MNYEWNLLKEGNEFTTNMGKYGVLILNRPVKINPVVMQKLWLNASWRITCDGGTDRWFDFVNGSDLFLPPPDQVVGDFDSIKPETLKFCQDHDDIEVVHTPDQNYTDFHKALITLFKSSPQKLDCYFAILDHCGRLDQTFSNINTLAQVEIPGFMVSSDSITWLLSPGNHKICIPSMLREKAEYCAILPFYPGTIKSTGLKWNLDGRKVEFGGLISSSNTYDGSPEVTITTDKTVIWIMGLSDLFL